MNKAMFYVFYRKIGNPYHKSSNKKDTERMMDQEDNLYTMPL